MYETHNFYCINCGKKTIPIQRKVGKMREKGHLKKLYCYNCRNVCNCYEVRNDTEFKEFKEKFEAGEFVELAKESIEKSKGD